MRAGHLTVPRTARYFALGPAVDDTRETWIVLHGHAQLAERFLRAFEPLEDGATAVVAPEALSRFYLETTPDGRHGKGIGATWLTREDREADLEDHMRYLDLLAEELLDALPDGRRLVVLGFSQGASMAARWAVRSRVVPDRLILWGSPPPDDVTPARFAERFSGRPVLLVAGDQDPVVPPGSIEAPAGALRTLGVRAEAQRFAGWHRITTDALLKAAGRSGKS